MADLSTQYMGIDLSSPVIVGACSLSGRISTVHEVEESGAGAMVIKSLFEEQIMAEALRLEEQLAVGAERFPESLTYFPPLEHAGPREHLMWVAKTRQAVRMPLFASLNAVSRDGWAGFARQLQDTGVDGLELNVYAVQTDLERTSQDVEQELYDTVQKVLDEVTIPVAVKLSPFYTSQVHAAWQLDQRGVKALVLFNRFLQPEIDEESQTLRNAMNLSRPEDARLPLRYMALLHGRVKADLVATTGIHSGAGVVRQLLAGATAVQVVSTLYLHGVSHIAQINNDLAAWMDRHHYAAIADFRGKLSQEDLPDRFAFERAQYVELLMQQT
jgi:dihydroorotate dehydrogenase (fumarate)